MRQQWTFLGIDIFIIYFLSSYTGYIQNMCNLFEIYA